jgi:hypothetical protein
MFALSCDLSDLLSAVIFCVVFSLATFLAVRRLLLPPELREFRLDDVDPAYWCSYDRRDH